MRDKIYFIGAGPGSPDLITLRGKEILRQADVVVYDYLVDRRLLDGVKDGAELICCDTLGKKRSSEGVPSGNGKVNRLVIKKFKEGKRVVRLKNGDVSFFSRTREELTPLVKKRIEFEIVPGVTAASAAGSFNGIPLTDRRLTSACVFVTGSEDPKKEKSSLDWKALAKCGTIILYMAVNNLPKIVKSLLEAGRSLDIPVAIAENVGQISQRLCTGRLKDIAAIAKKQGVKPPAIVIIGEVVRLEKDFNWFRKTKKIIFTGLSEQRFFVRGLVFHLPLIKIVPLEDYRDFDRQLRKITDYHWIVFASRYGVEYFFERLKNIGYDARILHKQKIAAIGNSTRNRLLDFGVIADLLPKEESSQGLIDQFKKVDLKSKKVFMPRSELADKGLALRLKAQGAQVTSGIAYRNLMPEHLPDLDLNNFDEVVLTSPSGVRNFIRRYGKLPKGVSARFVGEVTKREAKRCNLKG